MNTNILNQTIFCPHKKPNKLIFMLHGYGDNADNFINIAKIFHQPDFKINYIALNAPKAIIDYPNGRQWFDLYPNNIYISEAGPKEIKIIRSEIDCALKQILNNIHHTKNEFKLSLSDCFVFGFSQGGIITFELGNYTDEKFCGLAILSGRIISDQPIQNINFLKTPLFISHGNKDDVLQIDNFHKSCNYLKKNNFNFESHLLEFDSHIISPKAIDLLQKFVKKNL